MRHWERAIGKLAPLALFAVLMAATHPAVPQTEPPPVAVETARAAPIVEQVRLTGTVTSPRVARISTSVAGLIRTMRADGGDRVRKGEVLLKLDAELEQIAHRSAQAGVREAKAELANAERRLRVGQSLKERSSIPQNEVDNREAEVRIAEAAVERLEAERARAAARIRRHSLDAPFDGVVVRKLAETGEWVEPGTPVAELVATTGLRIDVPVPQDYFPRIEPESEVTVRLDALPETEIGARIGSLIPVSDPDARTFTMRVELDEPDIAITPGMSARVTLSLGTGERDVVVSRDAIIRYPDGRLTVWVAPEDGKTPRVSEQQVKTGLAFDGKVQIREGLKAGQRVVVRGNEALREGQAVRIQGGA